MSDLPIIDRAAPLADELAHWLAPSEHSDPRPLPMTAEEMHARGWDEVDAVFDVPLAYLMDEANHQRGSRMFQGRERFYYEMPYGERYIWGVTAGIIRMMYERLYL